MYISAIVCLALGAVIIFLGIQNMHGDVSSLHSYHRSRVKDEDVPKFGKVVGLGTLIVGASVAVMGVCDLFAAIFTVELLSIIGMALMGVGLVVGIVISFYAMKKYNGGIF